MKRKIFGLPLPIIAAVLSIALVTTGALAAFLMTREIPATVKIIGADAEVYQDEACTISLTTLDFGSIRAGDTSANLSIYIKNLGDDTLYCALARSGLDPFLTLYEGATNVVPNDPARLSLQTGTSVSDEWQVTATTTTLATDLAVDATVDMNCDDVSAFPDSGVVKIDDELIAYAARNEGIKTLETLTRGYDGTTPAAHGMDATITLMELVETTTPTYNLGPAGVLQATLKLSSSSSIERTDKSFTLIIEAKDTAY